MSGFIDCSVKLTQSVQDSSGDVWRDLSTADYFIYEAAFGRVQLRRRVAFPATYAVVEGAVIHLGYGRRLAGQAIAAEALSSVPEEVFYDEEFLYVAIDCQKQTVTMQRDAVSTVPIFVGDYGDRLVLSNDFATVALADSRQATVDEVALAEILLGRISYQRTLSKNIRLVYDRQRLNWSAAAHVLSLPPDAKHPPGTIPHAGDAHYFGRALEDTILKYWERYAGTEPVGCTLSYGLDSSLIAAVLADSDKHPRYVTAVYPGQYGESVTQKAHAFSARFQVESFMYPMDIRTDFPMSEVLNVQLRPLYHGGGMYDAVYDRLARQLYDEGVTTVFVGVGGDELCENIPDKAHTESSRGGKKPYVTASYQRRAESLLDRADRVPPIPILSRSTTSYAPAINNAFLAYAIWPVAPLCDPTLYAYCQSLPHHYRYKKAIMTAYGTARRLPNQILDFDANEDFSPFFDYAVAGRLGQPLTAVMQKSKLAEAGYIDTKKVREMFETACQKLATTGSEYHDNSLFDCYRLLHTEMTLRTAHLKL